MTNLTTLTLRDRLFRWLSPTLARNWEERDHALREETAQIRSERDYLRAEVESLRTRLENTVEAHYDDLRAANDWLCWSSNRAGMFSKEVDPQAKLRADIAEETIRARRSRRDLASEKTREFFSRYEPVPERPLPTQLHPPLPDQPAPPPPSEPNGTPQPSSETTNV